MNAYEDLMKFLEKDEVVEALVFGDYGWDGYGEDTKFVPKDKRKVVLTLEEAKPMMDGWTYYGGYGSPQCYATYLWTNKRVIWVTQYDGRTDLCSAPRSPVKCTPEMYGG